MVKKRLTRLNILIFKCLLILFVIYSWFSKYPVNQGILNKLPAQYVCISTKNQLADSIPIPYHAEFRTQSPTKDTNVLLLITTLSKHARSLMRILRALKIVYGLYLPSDRMHLLTEKGEGIYSLIIIDDYCAYLNIDSHRRLEYENYCLTYNAGMITFLSGNCSNSALINSTFGFTQLEYARNLHIMFGSKLAYFLKPGVVLQTPSPDRNDWVLFDTKGFHTFVSAENKEGERRAAVLYDEGKVDGVHRILFGQDFTHWIMKFAFVESIRYLSKGLVDESLDRSIQIDIDDIFLPPQKMHASDADALLASQIRLRRKISDFVYTLGFCGGFFHEGDELESLGDDRLIALAKNFAWFPHLYRHEKAILKTEDQLRSSMEKNKKFAEEMRLPLLHNYAITPHHSGIYPVHDSLYNAWKSVWNVSVTATELYLYKQPDLLRLGFIYQNLSVLPRHSSSIHTFSQLYSTDLEADIEGGILFTLIFLSPLTIFMTHKENYGSNRLGLFVFERLVDFIYCWTNLRLKWTEPREAAKAYFQKFPSERMPIWTNPCNHGQYSLEHNCIETVLPNLLIVGPQKSGSTALHMYLRLHPNFVSNDPIPGTFEELQFFGGNNYHRGVFWYMDNFRRNQSESQSIIFEKSATYFANSDAPRTASALVPNATIVVILLDPSIRAYSWYQHMRAHGDPIALSYSLGTILTFKSSKTVEKRFAWDRTITPGRYAEHLKKWFRYFSASQIHTVDGDELRYKPVHALEDLTAALNQQYFNFEAVLEYDKTKGFFCKRVNGRKNCFGPSKGRKYEPMDASLRTQLNEIYRKDNFNLYKTLVRYKKRVPNWLNSFIIFHK